MRPKFCDHCKQNRDKHGCNYAGCFKWRAWFHDEWEGIRKEAEKIKQKKEGVIKWI